MDNDEHDYEDEHKVASKEEALSSAKDAADDAKETVDSAASKVADVASSTGDAMLTEVRDALRGISTAIGEVVQRLVTLVDTQAKTAGSVSDSVVGDVSDTAQNAGDAVVDTVDIVTPPEHTKKRRLGKRWSRG